MEAPGFSSRLSPLERWLLVVPLLGGATFGVLPLLASPAIAGLFGYTGNDAYVYRIAGAASLGYAFALLPGINDGRWLPLRNVVVAVLAFNVVSILATLVEVAQGKGTPILFLITAASVAIVAITVPLLARHERVPPGGDQAPYSIAILVLATVAALFFGVAFFLPELDAKLFGYLGTDTYLWRQAGAATFGYGVMGIAELRAPRWEAMRLPTIMGLAFNFVSFLASVFELLRNPTLLAAVVGPASLLFSIAFIVGMARRGR